ncbi:LLM class flavin-dependent oxidoreductase [Paenibacillus taichungensis]|uniref:LLM class flavin-dependent oxidoreductase n=1 Tax=Paenibacillus taichungensis TaxID=484184 RepID=UPI00399F8B50
MSNLKNEIKLVLINKGMGMSDLIKLLNEKHNREDTVQNLNNKLTRGTIKYSEIKEIAEILNYKIGWIPEGTTIQLGDKNIILSTPLQHK